MNDADLKPLWSSEQNNVTYRYHPFFTPSDLTDFLPRIKSATFLILRLENKRFCTNTLCWQIIQNVHLYSVFLMGSCAGLFQTLLEQANEKATKRVETLEQTGRKVKQRDIPLTIARGEYVTEALFLGRKYVKSQDTVLLVSCLKKNDISVEEELQLFQHNVSIQ